jgi:hypothetical protein
VANVFPDFVFIIVESMSKHAINGFKIKFDDSANRYVEFDASCDFHDSDIRVMI